MFLQGKKGIILGVANQRSIAWGIAKALMDQGATVGFSYQNDRLRPNLEKLLDGQENYYLYECDVASDESIQNLVSDVENDMGKVDFVVHALAFADKQYLEQEFITTPREAFVSSLDISCYSLIALARAFEPLYNEGAALVTLSYLGAVNTVINYNVMGVAKAALEASVRYLAMDLGNRGVRINAISAGPVQTLAARGIRDFSLLHKIHPQIAPLKRTTTIEDVGGAGVFLCSSLSEGMTGEVVYVDGGFHNVAVGPTEAYNC